MDLALQQRQEMKMVMTTQLRQSIELLQYPTNKLEEFIREQQLENPLIELEERTSISSLKHDWSYKSIAGKQQSETMDLKEDIQYRDELYKLAKLSVDNAQHSLMKKMIYNLDDNGYIQNPEEIMSLEEYEQGVQHLQKVGPIGIGARNLRHCLLLQANCLYPQCHEIETLIKDYLELLANRKWEKISLHMDISLSRVKELAEQIKSFNPKPCALYSNPSHIYIQPDIIVNITDGKLDFTLNDYYLPKISLNEYYMNIGGHSKEETKQLSSWYMNYKWLVNSIDQRRQTMTKIMQLLMDKQRDFFTKGLSSIQALTLKDIAEPIEMHESTISRATMNKFIRTPMGTFDMKVLFDSKMVTEQGDFFSKTKIKYLLKELLLDENKLKPYSDQKIADCLLKINGIKISRRAIAKYREEMNIPSSDKLRIYNSENFKYIDK